MSIRQNAVILLLLLAIVSRAASPRVVEDYDSLSRFSSEKLMESGRHYFEKREAAKALACFMIVSERHKEQDSDADVQLSIRALNNMACVYKYYYYDYTQAYDYFIQAYDRCQEAHYNDFLPVVMVNLGDLLNDYSISYNSQPLSQQAQDIFEECMEKALETQHWELMTTAFFNLANQNYTLQVEKYRDLFSEKIPANTPDLQYVRLQYRGLQLLQQGKVQQARNCFQQQLAVVTTRWEPARDTLATYMSIAHTYQVEKDYQQEATYLQKALQLAENTQTGDQSAGICQLLAACYRQQGDSISGRRYHQLYLEKKEEIQANRLVSIAELNYIRELKQEQQRAKEMKALQFMQQMTILAIGIILIVVLAFVVMLFYKNRQLQARNRSLYEKNQQLLQAEQQALALRKEYEEEKKNRQTPASEEVKYSKSNLKDERRTTLVFRIEEVMNNAELICQQDFTLNTLTKLVESNTTYVSQVVNEKYGTAFSNVLADYRIREACRRISEETEQYRQLTIEAIATSVGFKSRTTFINAFKREVGLTPSEYLRQAIAQKA